MEKLTTEQLMHVVSTELSVSLNCVHEIESAMAELPGDAPAVEALYVTMAQVKNELRLAALQAKNIK